MMVRRDSETGNGEVLKPQPVWLLFVVVTTTHCFAVVLFLPIYLSSVHPDSLSYAEGF